MSLLSSSPIRDFETLEEHSWSSEEVNVSNSLLKGVWMEVLGKDVEFDIGLFPELLIIEVFNSNAYIILIN